MLTKKRLLEMLKDLSDDTEIISWRWTDKGAEEHDLWCTLGNEPEEKIFRLGRQFRRELSRGRESIKDTTVPTIDEDKQEDLPSNHFERF